MLHVRRRPRQVAECFTHTSDPCAPYQELRSPKPTVCSLYASYSENVQASRSSCDPREFSECLFRTRHVQEDFPNILVAVIFGSLASLPSAAVAWDFLAAKETSIGIYWAGAPYLADTAKTPSGQLIPISIFLFSNPNA